MTGQEMTSEEMSEPELSGITVTMRHVREEALCSRGMREWMKLHGFDWHDFVRNGLPVEQAEATGDEFARRVCARARKEWGAQ